MNVKYVDLQREADDVTPTPNLQLKLKLQLKPQLNLTASDCP